MAETTVCDPRLGHKVRRSFGSVSPEEASCQVVGTLSGSVENPVRRSQIAGSSWQHVAGGGGGLLGSGPSLVSMSATPAAPVAVTREAELLLAS